MAAGKFSVTFIESMERLPVAKLPEGPEWSYEIQLDGFRLEVVKTGKKVTVYSRRKTQQSPRRQHPHQAG